MLASTQQGYVHTSPTSGFVTGQPRLSDPTQNNYAWYLQDSWKLRPNFTLEVGTRWEYQGIYTQRNGLALQPVDPINGPWGAAGSAANLFNPLSTPAATDVPLQLVSGPNQHSLYKKDWNNFAPFMGFAWDPFKNGKTSVRGAIAMHYTQDGFTVMNNAATTAAGMTTTAVNSTPTGIYNPSSVPWPAAPVDTGVYSAARNWATSTASQIVGVNPNIRTPYVIEWNLAVQREIGKRITVEARYVGNHSVKLYRWWDTNELNLRNSPYTYNGNSVANILTEFKDAQNNLNVCLANNAACKAAAGITSSSTFSNFRNWGLSGQVPLPILDALFRGFTNTSTSGYGSTGFITNLQTNAAGSMFNTLRTSNTYLANRGAFPLNFFVANPWATLSSVMDNSAWSYYNGLEVEVRRRFSNGLFFQANWTWSRAISSQAFGTSQSESQPWLSLLNPSLDKFRSPLDQRHAIAANFIYPLPFGKGQSFFRDSSGVLDKIIGNWQLQGVARITTGSPFTISSGRWTAGNDSLYNDTAVIRNMTTKQLAKFIGTYKDNRGVFWLDPASGLIKFTSTGTSAVMCTPGQTTPCFDNPDPGSFGNTALFQWTGPFFWSQDFSLIKKIPVAKISEQFNAEFRVEMYNAFNHPLFSNPAPALTDSSKFGQLTGLADTSRGGGVNSRNMAFQLRINF